MGQLTVEQRYTIQILKQEGFSQKEISLRIGRDKSVVSRELSRNCDKRSGKYSADLAEKKCRKRHIEKKKRLSFTPDIQNKVEELLRTDYSPEQIVGNLKKLGVKCVSHERIYQYIWEDKKKGGVLYKHLRNNSKRYRKRGAAKDKRGQIPDKVGIETRPEIVEERSRIGDLEIDLVIGKNHKKAIVTINDRATGNPIIATTTNP